MKHTFYLSIICVGIMMSSNSIARTTEEKSIIPQHEGMQLYHKGIYSSSKGEFKMSQNNMNDETLWEKTKDVSARAWEATKEGTAKAWDKTKELGGDAWDKTKELSAKAGDAISDTSEDAWDATKDGTAKTWDKTKEVSAEAWDTTKEGTAKAWDKTKEVSEDAWDATKDATHNAKEAVTGEHKEHPMYNPENNPNPRQHTHMEQ